MKLIILSIGLFAAFNVAIAQEVVDTVKTTASDSVIMNETLKRQIESNEVGIEYSTDKNKSSITIHEDNGTDTTRFKLGKTEIIVLEGNRKSKNKKESSQFDDNWDDDNDDWDDDWDSEWKGSNKSRRSRFEGHWASIDLGLNLFSTKERTLSLPDSVSYLELDEGKSFEFAINAFQFNIPIVRDYLGIVSGVGFKWNTYRLDNSNVKLDNSQNMLAYSLDSSQAWIKSKLTMWALTVPVMLEGQVKLGHNRLWIAGGAYGTLKLGSKTKMKTKDFKIKERRDYHMNPLQYGLTARVGFENFGIYANYSLSSLFKTNEGPELYPFSVGVTLTFN